MSIKGIDLKRATENIRGSLLAYQLSYIIPNTDDVVFYINGDVSVAVFKISCSQIL